MVEKFICKVCNNTVKVNDIEDIIRVEKTCADCSTEHITGGYISVKKNNSFYIDYGRTFDTLKREPRKK